VSRLALERDQLAQEVYEARNSQTKALTVSRLANHRTQVYTTLVP